MKINDIELDWLGHSAFKIKTGKKIIYIDPYQINSRENADIILITHGHYDHCSLKDINEIAKDGTIILCTADCQSILAKIQKKVRIQLVEPGALVSMDNIKIHSIPAYNNNKKFHTKAEGWVGFVIQINNTVIYHAGDTDLIKEMSNLTGYGKKGNYFLALLPIGGQFTMNAEEAAKAAEVIKPTLAVPIHWGTIVGSKTDAEKFIKLCEAEGINAKILEKV